MSRGEAERLFRRGLRFRQQVVLEPNQQNATANKVLRLIALNNRYNGRGVTFSRGFHTHEHHVKIAGSPGSYVDLCRALAQEPDGGIASARAVRDWYGTDGGNRLSTLSPRQKILVVLSHFSETSRGYGQTVLNQFKAWIEEIAHADDRDAARDLWERVKDVYPPALTYAEDSRVDWEPGSEDSSSDSDDAMSVSDEDRMDSDEGA